jgi:hypothetical protein
MKTKDRALNLHQIIWASKKLADGYTLTDIGKVFDVHRRTVANSLEREGFLTNMTKRPLVYNPDEKL